MLDRRIAAVIVAGVVTAAVAASPTPASAMADACGWADIQPKTSGDLLLAENAVICLINKERTALGGQALKFNQQLFGAARNHSQEMVARVFFSHVNPSGQDIDVRFPKAGYALTGNWAIGENIHCAPPGALSTAREAVKAWMKSTEGHRATLLSSKYADTAVGAKIGATKKVGATGKGCTQTTAVAYTMGFGRHS